MRVWLDKTPKGLRNGDNTRTGFDFAGGFSHQLLDGLIGEASEITD